ncbi:MAG: tetratricopeptide repeat protein, partial [bacterium]
MSRSVRVALMGPGQALVAALLAASVHAGSVVDDRVAFEEAEASAWAAVREGRGASSEVREVAERALALSEPFARGSPQLAARGEQLYGRILLERGETHEAGVHFERALTLQRACLPPDAVATMEAVADAADATLRSGAGEQAAVRLAELAAATSPLPRPLEARVLELRSRVERDQGRYDTAFDLAERARALRDTEPDDPSALVETLNLLGELEWFRSRFDASRDRYREALDLAQKTVGPRHPLAATSMAGLAVAQYDLGGVEEALRLEAEALEIATTTRGPDHPDTADRLQDLATFSLGAGDYAKALLLYEQAMDVTERRLGPQSEEAANLLYNLAVLHSRMGRLEQAGLANDRALSI